MIVLNHMGYIYLYWWIVEARSKVAFMPIYNFYIFVGAFFRFLVFLVFFSSWITLSSYGFWQNPIELLSMTR